MNGLRTFFAAPDTVAELSEIWRARFDVSTVNGRRMGRRRAATATHALLYALMFAIPITGWLFNSSAGFPPQWFGLASLPAIASASPVLKTVAHALHVRGVWLLVALVALHAASALEHHFVDRDRTLG